MFHAGGDIVIIPIGIVTFDLTIDTIIEGIASIDEIIIVIVTSIDETDFNNYLQYMRIGAIL